MFEFHDDTSAEAVSALFGEGTYFEGLYVENTETGDLLASAGGLGRYKDGRTYLLRWNGRTLPLHARKVRSETDLLKGLEWWPAKKPAHIGNPAADRWNVHRLKGDGLVVFTLKQLGTSIEARRGKRRRRCTWNQTKPPPPCRLRPRRASCSKRAWNGPIGSFGSRTRTVAVASSR